MRSIVEFMLTLLFEAVLISLILMAVSECAEAWYYTRFEEGLRSKQDQ